jgi:hypothetical protein
MLEYIFSGITEKENSFFEEWGVGLGIKPRIVFHLFSLTSPLSFSGF